jgi:adenylate cyclase
MPRQPSTHNLAAARKSRPSESHSIAESTASSTSGDTAQMAPPTDLRKSKSSLSIFTTILKKSRSRGRLRSETEHIPHFSQSQSFAPPPEALALSLTTPSSPIPVLKGRGKRKPPSSVPPVPPVEPAIRLDTDLGKMDGIVDPAAHPTLPDSISSFGSVMGLNLTDATSSYDFGADPVLASPRTSMFSNPNPFQPSLINRGSHDRPSGILDRRKISPKTIPPIATPSSPEHASKSLDLQLPTWTAPESWAVDKDGAHADEPEYSSSEDSVTSSTRPNSSSAQVQKRKTRRKIAGRPSRPSVSGSHAYSVRIYRANNSYHVASIPLSLTVADLTPVLHRKVLMGEEREVHRLYLKERGRGEERRTLLRILSC